MSTSNSLMTATASSAVESIAQMKRQKVQRAACLKVWTKGKKKVGNFKPWTYLCSQ